MLFILSFVEIRPHYVAQARLKFTIFLAQSLKCCGYKYGHDAGQNGFSCRPVFCLIKFWPRVSTALDLSWSTNKAEIGWPLLVFFIESVETSFSRLLGCEGISQFYHVGVPYHWELSLHCILVSCYFIFLNRDLFLLLYFLRQGYIGYIGCLGWCSLHSPSHPWTCENPYVLSAKTTGMCYHTWPDFKLVVSVAIMTVHLSVCW